LALAPSCSTAHSRGAPASLPVSSTSLHAFMAPTSVQWSPLSVDISSMPLRAQYSTVGPVRVAHRSPAKAPRLSTFWKLCAPSVLR
jgi:hypothetical protein